MREFGKGIERLIRRERVGSSVGDDERPFEAGEHKQIAVKVIDDRGNELLVVKKL